jgi:hypothetical protein
MAAGREKINRIGTQLFASDLGPFGEAARIPA